MDFLVHARASNLACWGDSGRVSLVIQLLKQTLNYYKRLEFLHYSAEDCLVRHAFAEQKNLSLPWLRETENFIANLKQNITDNLPSSVIRSSCKDVFEHLWHSGIQQSSKLQFYSIVKGSIGYEPYLSVKDIRKRKAVAQLRFSSHRLNIETARYINNKSDVHPDKLTWKKCCRICCNNNVQSLISLPFADPILEDEHHVLVSCPKFEHIRQTLSDHVKSSLISWDQQKLIGLFDNKTIHEFSSYVLKILHTHSNSTK